MKSTQTEESGVFPSYISGGSKWNYIVNTYTPLRLRFGKHLSIHPPPHQLLRQRRTAPLLYFPSLRLPTSLTNLVRPRVLNRFQTLGSPRLLELFSGTFKASAFPPLDVNLITFDSTLKRAFASS